VITDLLAPFRVRPVHTTASASGLPSTKTLISDRCFAERAEEEPEKEVRVFWEEVKSERT
jgi:hypothetical protein